MHDVKVPIGRLVATPGAARIDAVDALRALARHVQGDWGDVCAEDKRANDQALKDGTRILSAYTAEDGTRFWILTEADRSATTIMLPSEY